MRVTSQPRPVASGQLILTSLSVSLSRPYTSLQEANLRHDCDGVLAFTVCGYGAVLLQCQQA